MKKNLITFKKSLVITTLILTCVIFQRFILGQNDNETNVPPGMEIKTVDNINVLIPKGSRIYKTGNVLQIESVSEYSAREFEDLKKRIDSLDNKCEMMQKEIDILKASQKT